jgi:hypothetical protein
MIFPDIAIHDTMLPFESKVVSAGYCNIVCGYDGVQVDCWGNSTSLNKVSRGGIDSKLILTAIEKY